MTETSAQDHSPEHQDDTPPPPAPSVRRRAVVGTAGAAVVALLATRLGDGRGRRARGDAAAAPPPAGRLTVRATTPTQAPFGSPGVHQLGVRPGRDTLLSVPATYRPDRPAPLVVALHGAGGDAAAGLALLADQADDAGLLILAPASEGRTWDVILGGFGPDVGGIDEALRRTFARYAVDPDRVHVAGFSDGASYALSLGLTNGDLFRGVVAFSPGFAAPARPVGRPEIFISHGRSDAVLPIDPTSRRVVPRLRDAGYDPLYREFDGGHTVPADIAAAAVAWMADRRP